MGELAGVIVVLLLWGMLHAIVSAGFRKVWYAVKRLVLNSTMAVLQPWLVNKKRKAGIEKQQLLRESQGLPPLENPDLD